VLTKRLIACFDVVNGRVTKAQQFQDNIDVAPAEELAQQLYADQIDEIVFYDIKASAEKRKIDLDTVRRVAHHVFVPFTVGGGIRAVEDIRRLLLAGADKVSINTEAVTRPEFVREAAEKFGSQCIVVAIDAKQGGHAHNNPPFEVFTHGGRKATGIDAVAHAVKLVEYGAGEILLTSMDRDGVKSGYDLKLTRAVADAVPVPVIASGGVGKLDDLVDGVVEGHASAVLAASIFHFGQHTIAEAKAALAKAGLPVRLP